MNASNKDIDPFEDFFHDRLNDFESDVDDALWAKIEPQLPLPSFSRLMLWHLAAAVALLLLSFGLLPRFVDSSNVELSHTTAGTLRQNEGIQDGKNTNAESKQTFDKSIPNTTRGAEVNHNSINSEASKDQKEDGLVKSEKANSSSESSLASSTSKTDEPTLSSNIGKKNLTKSTGEISSKSLRKAKKNLNKKVAPSGLSTDEYDRIVRATQNTGDYLSTSEEALEPNLEILASKEPVDLSVKFNKARIKTQQRKPNRYFQPSKPVSLYFSAMPLVNYYTITPNGSDSKYVHNIQVDDDNSRLGVYLQAGLKFTLSDKLQLKTGISYTKSSQSISFKVRTDSLVVRSVDNQTADVAFEEQNKTYALSSHYLGTRVDLEYTFLKGDALSHHVLVGMEGNTSLNGTAAGKINSFLNIGYGISRQIGDNAYIFIEPTMSIALNHQSDASALLLVRPNKIGFNIGLNFKIK
ncbi:outer membrane beta-barrel protein [Flectobacillus roseus]|uniref:Outer membrane beta-barrel protein n=1 Tax=Flectobacillus roseus TaxID=502259 RepID=A0ABT6YFX3_9BACT|nr:outer membrane beta-barrel protein [Flectobacillus roseus]MDI9862493.1 outer membrane beta-barrel protein [Flectobacillus roseus]